MPNEEGKPGILRKISDILNSAKRAEIFLSATELMSMDNYTRALAEELEQLGDGQLEVARMKAREREPEGYAVLLKRHHIAVGLRDQE